MPASKKHWMKSKKKSVSRNDMTTPVTRELIEEAFPDAELVFFDRATLHELVKNSRLLQRLSDTGLPDSFTDALLIDLDSADRTRTVGAFYADNDGACPGGANDLILLGTLGSSVLAADGTSGEIALVDEGKGVQIISDDIDVFLKILIAMSTAVRSHWTSKSDSAPEDFYHSVLDRTFHTLDQLDIQLDRESLSVWREIAQQFSASAY